MGKEGINYNNTKTVHTMVYTAFSLVREINITTDLISVQKGGRKMQS